MSGNLSVDVRFESAQVTRQMAQLKSGQVQSAAARALNRAATTARKEAVSDLHERMGLKVRSLTKRIRLTNARSKNLEAILRAFDYDPALSGFRPKWKRRPLTPVGASVRIPGLGTIVVPGAFVEKTTHKGMGVYTREGATTKRGKKGHGYPIKFMRFSDIGLPTLAKAFLENAVTAKMTATGRRRFAEEFTSEIARRSGNR